MLGSLFYSFRLNRALAKLGISAKRINPSFKDGTIHFAKKDGLSPSETAVYIFYQLPEEYQANYARDIIDQWIKDGMVRLEVVRQLKEMRESVGMDFVEPEKDLLENVSDPKLVGQIEKFRKLIGEYILKQTDIASDEIGLSKLSASIQAVLLSRYIALEVCKRSHRDITTLSEKESYSLKLLCYLLAVYIARAVYVDTAQVASESLVNLIENEDSQLALEQIRKIIVLHDEMVHDPRAQELLKAVATQVVQLVYTADTKYLDQISSIYDIMCSRM